jgi:hypothetical protein
MTFHQYLRRIYKLIETFETESARGIACVHDTLLDEVTKELLERKHCIWKLEPAFNKI